MEDRETARVRKYGESKTTRIMMATVPHVTSGLGLRKFQADGFLLTRVYQVAGCTTCQPIDAEAGGTRSNRSWACMQAGTTRLIRYIGPSRASQSLSAVYSTSVAFHRQKHSRIDTAVNHVIMKLWLDHLGTIFKPYRESWDISRQTSSPHPLTCTDTIIPPSVRPSIIMRRMADGMWV